MSVDCGQNFVLLLARDRTTKRGVVFSAGANDEGQLGNGMPTGHGGQVQGFQQKLLPVSLRRRERVQWEECVRCSLVSFCASLCSRACIFFRFWPCGIATFARLPQEARTR